MVGVWGLEPGIAFAKDFDHYHAVFASRIQTKLMRKQWHRSSECPNPRPRDRADHSRVPHRCSRKLINSSSGTLMIDDDILPFSTGQKPLSFLISGSVLYLQQWCLANWSCKPFVHPSSQDLSQIIDNIDITWIKRMQGDTCQPSSTQSTYVNWWSQPAISTRENNLLDLDCTQGGAVHSFPWNLDSIHIPAGETQADSLNRLFVFRDGFQARKFFPSCDMETINSLTHVHLICGNNKNLSVQMAGWYFWTPAKKWLNSGNKGIEDSSTNNTHCWISL